MVGMPRGQTNHAVESKYLHYSTRIQSDLDAAKHRKATSMLSHGIHHASIRPTVAALTLLVSLALANRMEAAQEGSPDTNRAVVVSVDPRVELMSIIFHLAGNPEYNKGRVESYTKDVDDWFQQQRDHPVVQLARQLRRTRGVSYDAVMSMAVHVKDAASLEERPAFEPRPETLDQRWHTALARDFLDAARDFVQQTDFEKFFQSHRPLFKESERRLQKVLDEEAHLEWFEKFFGARPKAKFSVFIGMLNGGSCYGPRTRLPDGEEELYCVLGAWSTDREGIPKFDAGMLNTVIHEFCHSYANAIVDQNAEALRPAGEKLFGYVEDAMGRQAYGNWKTMMYESLVRACTIRYLRTYEGRLAAMKQTMEDRSRQFLWIGQLASLLATYAQQRDQYATLNDFAPRIVEFFDEYAERFVKTRKELDQKRPKVVTMMPTKGAKDVDPALAVIKLVFDRPMQDDSWSMVGGGPNFPELAGKPSYDETRKIWSVPVKLRPGWSYTYMLNSDRFTGFRSTEGVPLAPVTVTFQTGAQRKGTP